MCTISYRSALGSFHNTVKASLYVNPYFLKQSTLIFTSYPALKAPIRKIFSLITVLHFKLLSIFKHCVSSPTSIPSTRGSLRTSHLTTSKLKPRSSNSSNNGFIFFPTSNAIENGNRRIIRSTSSFSKPISIKNTILSRILSSSIMITKGNASKTLTTVLSLNPKPFKHITHLKASSGPNSNLLETSKMFLMAEDVKLEIPISENLVSHFSRKSKSKILGQLYTTEERNSCEGFKDKRILRDFWT
ncbi:unnamed protein product [Coffea canephora]|uniref:DH200=94 genomic scaffold, scaffold_202 n=1 Tax=Coffea canephora TaxID=49390 RepID=A0A068VB50_COFCA|nr:unnamed protein product [Coffea canephora]